jgi:hypothetical protein
MGACLLASVGTAVPARAQDTRAETIVTKQAEKAKAAKPYTPSRFERIMTSLEETFASPPDGFYPQVGSVPQGGGFSAGVGYRNFFGREGVFDIRGAYSLKNYFQVEAGVRRPWHVVVPAWPPGASRSMSTVFSPSLAP